MMIADGRRLKFARGSTLDQNVYCYLYRIQFMNHSVSYET